MKKILLILFVFGILSINAQDVDITFRVNISQIEGMLETDFVWVVMDADEEWNWIEYYEMAADNDSIYSFTLTIASGGNEVVQQYSFAYGEATDNYTDWETPPEECANENDYSFIH